MESDWNVRWVRVTCQTTLAAKVQGIKSKEFMIANPKPGPSWTEVQHFNALGHILSSNGSNTDAWKAANSRTLKRSYEHIRNKDMTTGSIIIKVRSSDSDCIHGLLRSCSIGPQQAEISKNMDRMQVRLVARLLRLPRMPCEASYHITPITSYHKSYHIIYHIM